MEAINSEAYQYLLSLIGENIKVVRLGVYGKWLRADLETGGVFMVKNADYAL